MNHETVLFEEVQGFAPKSVGRFAGLLAACFAVGWCMALVRQKHLTEDATSFYVSGLLFSTVAWLLLQLKMITQVREDGIYVRVKVLQPSFVVYRWSEIRQLYLRNCNALMEYGGWGIRYGPSGRAYIFSGSTGLQLELHNGNKVFIGTRRPQELEALLLQMHRRAKDTAANR